ncbi:MAG: hypothetical protein IIA00_07825 [Proteobacteria bacterium]|nr:hypothetical protein [Pseudomonadota bacterium]
MSAVEDLCACLRRTQDEEAVYVHIVQLDLPAITSDWSQQRSDSNAAMLGSSWNSLLEIQCPAKVTSESDIAAHHVPDGHDGFGVGKRTSDLE